MRIVRLTDKQIDALPDGTLIWFTSVYTADAAYGPVLAHTHKKSDRYFNGVINNVNFHTDRGFLEAQLRLSGYQPMIRDQKDDDDGTDTTNV